MFIIVNIFYIRHLASRDSRRPHNANVCKVSPIRDVPYPKKTDKRIDFAKGYFDFAHAQCAKSKFGKIKTVYSGLSSLALSSLTSELSDLSVEVSSV